MKVTEQTSRFTYFSCNVTRVQSHFFGCVWVSVMWCLKCVSVPFLKLLKRNCESFWQSLCVGLPAFLKKQTNKQKINK